MDDDGWMIFDTCPPAEVCWMICLLSCQVISHYQCKEQRDAHRFEKISNIIKQFKLSCRSVRLHSCGAPR